MAEHSRGCENLCGFAASPTADRNFESGIARNREHEAACKPYGLSQGERARIAKGLLMLLAVRTENGKPRTIAYDVIGSGVSDILLLHGLNSFRERWRSLGYAEHFARNFRVIAMDFAGHGESSTPHEPQAYALESVLQDVSAVLDAAGSREPVVLGFSYGGRLALHLSHCRPLKAILALGARFGVAMSAERCTAIAAEWDRILDLVETGRFDGDAFSREARIEIERNDIKAVRACTLAFGGWPQIRPSEITAPALFLAGERDPERIEAFHDWRAEIGQNAHIDAQTLPGVDHAMTFFNPSFVLPRVDAFLSRVRAPTGF